MGYTLKIEVKDCRDCPCRYTEHDHGASWEACNHPGAPDGYSNTLWYSSNDFRKTPSWCPITTGGKL